MALEDVAEIGAIKSNDPVHSTLSFGCSALSSPGKGPPSLTVALMLGLLLLMLLLVLDQRKS
jgi:hypothetical protein